MANSQILDDVQKEEKTDMTPMIDCVFLMIIFFLCIDFKILEAKLPAYLPKDKGSQDFKVEPKEQLSLGIYVQNAGDKIYLDDKGGPNLINPNTDRPYRFVLKNHKVRYLVGPTPIFNEDDLIRELRRIAEDRNTWQTDEKTNELKPMPVVIEPHEGTYYADAAIAADACKEAGFREINFGGGLGAMKQN